jgi:hypothetical protein
MSGTGRDQYSQVAESVPFDNATNGFVADNAQTAIEELKNIINTSASPGFTWGNSGTVTNAFLLNDTVPSNKSGRLVSITGNIVSVFVALELATTVAIEIKRNVLGVFTTIATANMVASRKNTFAVSIPVSINDELACYVNGSCKSPVVGIVVKG